MLRSLPRERIVVAISYGCIGRSHSVTRTASASGLETARRPAISSPTLSACRSGGVYPYASIRLRVSACKHSPASILTTRGGWGGDPVGQPRGGARRTSRGRGQPGPPGRGRLDAGVGVPVGDRAG